MEGGVVQNLMHFEHYSPFLIPFSLCFLWPFVWCYLGFRVWFNFSRWGVGLFDLCENRHPIEVAEHFPVMTFSPPWCSLATVFPCDYHLGPMWHMEHHVWL
jgi:hypothetical protein